MDRFRRPLAVLLSLCLLGAPLPFVFPPEMYEPTEDLGSALYTPAVLGSRTFPTSQLTGRLEMAFGADRTADPNTWVWTDVSAYVRHQDRVVISFGRDSEGQFSPPATMVLALNSDDGRFLPDFPTGAYYPYVRLGVPVRWYVNPGNGLYERFSGYVSEWQPTWDATGNQTIVRLRASGISRQIGQGSAVMWPARRSVLATDPLAYWPLEDGTDATQGANLVPSGAPLIVDPLQGDVGFGMGEGVSGWPNILDASVGGRLTGTVPAGASSTEWRVDFVARLPDDFTGFVQGQMLILHTEGTYAEWQVLSNSSDWRLIPYLTDGTSPGGSIASGQDAHDGQLHHYRIEVEQSGSSIAVRGYQDGVLGINTTLSSATVGRITAVEMWYETQESANMPAIGHVAVWAPYTATSEDLSGLLLGTAYVGETAGNRFLRVLSEAGVIATVDTGATSTMGQQTETDLIELLRESESVDHGMITDYQFGMRMIPRVARYNRPADLELDSGLIEPPRPTLDDLDIRNDVTVSSPTGSSGARYEDEEHVTERGRYDETREINAPDDELYDHAAWLVHLGTVEGMRYPQIVLNLRRVPELIAPWCAAGLGSRIVVTGLPAGHPPDGLDLIVEGYTETFDSFRWTVEINASPSRPYEVFEVEHSQFGRLDTESSELAVAVDETDTLLLITSDEDERWTTSAAYPADFPFDVNLAGERITVTAVADAFYVGRGTAVHDGNGGAVQPTVHADSRENDLIVLFGACRDTSAVMDTPSGYAVLFGDGHVAAFYKVHSGSESAPTVTFAGAGANDTVSAQTITLRGVRPVVTNLTNLSNASAQNIALPALTVPERYVGLWFGWKADDWTGAGDLFPGITEIDEPTTTLGDDQSIVWNYSFEPSGESFGTGAWTITGGAAAISKSYALALPADRQAVTVTRSVNGVSKAHAAGTAVRLWRPGQVAL